MSHQTDPRIVITEAARTFIEDAIASVEKSKSKSESVIAIVTFPIWIEQLGQAGSRRFTSERGGLASLGLIERDQLKNELITRVGTCEIAIRPTTNMLGRDEIKIDFHHEHFLSE